MAAAKSIQQKLLRGAWQFFVFLFLSSFFYAIICKWIYPPTTFTQMYSTLQFRIIKKQHVSWNNISYSVKLATLASEDPLFVMHKGFDWNSIGMSVYKNTSFGSKASTISQQVAKNIFLFQGNGFVKIIRKLEESYFTILLEYLWSKKRILESYLNIVEMGPGIFGIEAAATDYFHKSATDLTFDEAAMIIACLPNPKKLSPGCKVVKTRYMAIINQMYEIEKDMDIVRFINTGDD